MSYLALKSAHILSAFLLFGTGLGSAFYKYMTWRSGDLHAIAVTDRLVVRADWLFTTPTIIIQPLTGGMMLWLTGIPFDSPWLVASYLLYLLAGACWLPVVWLQLRMSRLSSNAVNGNTPLPDEYRSLSRWWFWLGVPAFIAMVLVVLLMVFKPV